MRILLMGYYGYGNIGDDLFVKQLTTYFSKQENIKEVFVICEDDYYEKPHEKVSFFSAKKLSKLQRLFLYLKSDRVAWGGGTLNISGKPGNLLKIQSLLKLTGKSFSFLGIGLESVNAKEGSGIISSSEQVFKNSYLLYLRDYSSYELAQKYLNAVKHCCLGGDLAFLDLSIYQPFIKTTPKPSYPQNISFSGKFWWGNSRAEFYAQQLIPWIEKYNTMIHLLPGHVGDERNDNRFHQLMIKYLPASNYQLHNWKKPEEFLEILSQMDFHIGNRLHSVILADILGIPNIGIASVNSKISNYIDKTEVLPLERLAEFMEPLTMERVEKIFREYQRPVDFIENESKASEKCLQILLQK